MRCPFATVEACPRYYQSLSLMGMAGSTSIPKAEDDRLLALWKVSDLWPRTAEQATAISGADGRPDCFSNFCPEVLFDRFGVFATYLARYADEIDRAAAQHQLQVQGAPAGHPLWSWQSAKEQHFTECTLYAVLQNRPSIQQHEPKLELPWWRKHVIEIATAVLVALVGLLAKCVG